MSPPQGRSDSLLAGAVAGSVESFVTYPTEFVKTRAQLLGKPQHRQTKKPRSLIGIIKDTYGKTGVRGFYAGCPPVIFGNALKAGTRFFAFETCRDMMRNADGKLTPSRNMLAGVVAGIAESVLAVTPSEAIKTRIIETQASGSAIRQSSLAIVSGIIRTESLFGLYRGLLPTILKQSSNSAVRFSSYEFMKDAIKRRSSNNTVTNPQTVLIGSLAGVITVYSTMPFDVVKTRMQQGGKVYRSSLDCFSNIVRKEGLSTFWKGSSPRVLRLVVSGSISFLVYENVLKALRPSVSAR